MCNPHLRAAKCLLYYCECLKHLSAQLGQSEVQLSFPSAFNNGSSQMSLGAICSGISLALFRNQRGSFSLAKHLKSFTLDTTTAAVSFSIRLNVFSEAWVSGTPLASSQFSKETLLNSPCRTEGGCLGWHSSLLTSSVTFQSLLSSFHFLLEERCWPIRKATPTV